jgi:hypothetical protein
MVDEEIGMPAKRELSMRQLRHLFAASPRWGERPRDPATFWRGALDDPGQSQTGAPVAKGPGHVNPTFQVREVTLLSSPRFETCAAGPGDILLAARVVAGRSPSQDLSRRLSSLPNRDRSENSSFSTESAHSTRSSPPQPNVARADSKLPWRRL